MINFSKYKAILWDFDGVLIDSMPVRDKGFEKVLAQYPKQQVEQLLQYHRQNGGLSRYVKFRYFFEQIRHEPITEDQVFRLADDFSRVMKKELVNKALLIEDSLSFVKRYYQQYSMYIVSGSDEKELNFLCTELGIARYFQAMKGSPTPKRDLVKQVLAFHPPEDCVLIGDSENDYQAAVANGVVFCGYNNSNLQGQAPYYISTFKCL